MSLRELRRAKVLSQRELASRAKVSQKTIVDIETGKIRPHPSTLRKLAEALGVDPEALASILVISVENDTSSTPSDRSYLRAEEATQ